MTLTDDQKRDRIDATADILTDLGLPTLAARLRDVIDELLPEPTPAPAPSLVDAGYAVVRLPGMVAEVERLRAQIGAVRTLHSEDDGECETCPDPFHPGTREPWPCPTIQALDGEGSS